METNIIKKYILQNIEETTRHKTLEEILQIPLSKNQLIYSPKEECIIMGGKIYRCDKFDEIESYR